MPAGKWSSKTKEAIWPIKDTQITTVGNWCLILLRNFERQNRAYALTSSRPRNTSDQDENLGTPESASFHKHTEYTATSGAMASERNTETNWVTLTHWMTEKISTSTLIGKAETHFYSTPRPLAQHQAIRRELPTSSFSLRSEVLAHMSNISSFQALKANGAWIHESYSIIANKADFKWVQNIPVPSYIPRIRAEGGSRWKHHLPVSAWRHLPAYISGWCLKVSFSNPLNLADECDPPFPRIQKEQAVTCCIFPLRLAPTKKPTWHLPGSRKFTYQVLQLFQWPSKG